MKFLSKREDSAIIQRNLIYRANNSVNNRNLLLALLNEQQSFCAYTEQYILQDENNDFLASVDVEHFTASKKGTSEDDYYNWYAVLHRINIKKLDEKYAKASFHQSRFFQNRAILESRIEYSVEDNLYFEIDSDDDEARDFIDFILIDSHTIARRRKANLNKLEAIFEAKGTKEAFVEYLIAHRQDLSFITAIEEKFGVELEKYL